MGHKLGKIRELIDEALSPEEFADLCFDDDAFRAVYNKCDGQSRSSKIRSLVDYASRHDRMDDLLKLIEGKNKPCFGKYRHEIKDFVPNEIKYFDLNQSIEKSWEGIYHKKGVIALSVTCSDNTLIHNFSTRLKEKLSKKNKNKVDLETQQIYNPAQKTIAQIVETISKRTVKVRKGSTRIFPIFVDDRDPSELWTCIQKSFQNKLDFCLVVIIFSNLSYLSMSNDVIVINPEFKVSHLCYWIDDLTEKLNSKQTTEEWTTISDDWKERAIEYCEPDNMGNLNIKLVYKHLEETQSSIQEDDAKISPEEFKKVLNIIAPRKYSHV